MNADDLLTLQPYLRIIHHIPGRIRIKFEINLIHYLKETDYFGSGMASPGIKFEGELLGFLRKQGLLDPHKTLPGIQNVRLNVSARSIVIKYDPDCWRPQWVDELLTTKDPARFRLMLKEFTG